MPKKMEVEFEENQKKIDKLVARNKEIEMRMKARTKLKNRKERTHKMCTLSGDFEKVFSDVLGVKLFDNEFELKRFWLQNFFKDYLRVYFDRFDYFEMKNDILKTYPQWVPEGKSQKEIEPGVSSRNEIKEPAPQVFLVDEEEDDDDWLDLLLKDNEEENKK